MAELPIGTASDFDIYNLAGDVISCDIFKQLTVLVLKTTSYSSYIQC